MSYQDSWIDGQTVTRGDRACASRYDLIRPVLQAYQRPFTVWDLGANLGYFGCRIAAEFGAVSVMVDPRAALVETCRANALPTTIAMTHRLTAADLAELAASEHADVVLALNVLHHMSDWREALTAILALGETVIIETPSDGDSGSANYRRARSVLKQILSYKPDVIGSSPSHVTPWVSRQMFVLRQPKTAVTASYAYRGRVRPRGPHAVRPHTITSTLADKSISYVDGESRPWAQGMNLWNWLQMGGSYPGRSAVQVQVCRVAAALSEPHGDFKPWNLILQGQSLRAIDGGHRMSVDDAQGLAQTLAWIDQPERAYVC